MKRISSYVVLTALAFAAQGVFAEDSVTPSSEASAESAEAYLNVAAIGSAPQGSIEMVVPEQPGKRGDLLEELGLASHGPFPSSGGPIDGGDSD